MSITYIVYWNSGKCTKVHGTTVKSALSKSGYTEAQIKSVAFSEKGSNQTWKWVGGKWIQTI